MSKSNKTNNIILISWTKYSRHTDLLGKAINAEIFFIDKFFHFRGILWYLLFPFDYFLKSCKTFLIIKKTKPDFVFIQNPPSLAPIVLIIIKKFKNFKAVFDSHNAAFEKPWISIPGYRWALIHADLVIIHNSQLYKNLIKIDFFKKVKFKILNSKLTDFSDYKKQENNKPYILIVTTFAGDEPMDELLEGIRKFNIGNNNKIKFKITGNYNKREDLYKTYYSDENIEFLGFVSDNDYKNLIVNALCIISLSIRNDVQQFALMEAVGAEIPFISSNNITNNSLFNDKMILTENKSDAIAKSIKIFMNNRNKYLNNILYIKKKQIEKWENDFKNIKIFLSIDN